MPEKYLGKSKYRIAQVADNRFIVEERIITVYPWWSWREPVEEWKWVKDGPIRLMCPFSTLDSARKWISDTRKYPIYHEAEPDSTGRDYENLDTK